VVYKASDVLFAGGQAWGGRGAPRKKMLHRTLIKIGECGLKASDEFFTGGAGRRGQEGTAKKSWIEF